VVVLSDPRLLTKRYGRELLDALPPAKRVIGAWGEVRGDVARFYRGRTAKA